MVTIRRATKEDVKTLIDFFSRMYRLNSEFDPLLLTPENLEERINKVVEKSLEDQNEMIVVAEDQGRIVGAARVLIIDRIFYTPEKEALIREFYVHPSYRRQGVGNEIVNFIISELKERGIEILGAEFPSRNLIAISFYRKMGFREIYCEFIKKI
ncbi:MAG: GNAT family N-acetyltransferase [Saccharolobus sp.]|uniref:N-terminal acetyltransferase complex subunit n=5 Tax=Saccharolobus TaxID=2100760 RepID=A0A8F5BTB5_9CREN|nr:MULTISPECIES: GNAT family N-acetyltransferase [Sulfolobaceae]ACP39163.1 GCN5-related N-acetyltransferase [Sulfolobus islandicus M.14.25]ACP56363.1 GCN5-related N-acetyltransferase [Sulfolobus islandicus M.16.27]ACR43039.1 GCN5-related N-acetyltransferase [Sulfolobus islandicus M.16.4]MCH4816619.1 GNAT family N-acetyltransferase [Saccharolobus shibatae]QXJ27738.1 N-terminal acetyltransferase complex subunit [Saccharolobus shibatae B12]